MYKVYDLALKVLEEKPIYTDMANSTKVAEFINAAIQPQTFAEERMYIIALSTKGDVIGYIEHSKGTLNSSLVDVAGIFKFALLCNANSIILTHNHPSGNTTPSQEDIQVTRRVKDAGDLLSVPLLDHIITTPSGDYDSIRSNSTIW